MTSLYLHIPVDVAEDDVWEPLGVLRLTYDGTYWRSSGYLTAHALWLPGMPTWQQVKLTLKQLQWLVFAGPELCSKEV